ncbi:MAG: hypothetical protein HQK49_04395 [Oligoflexia bacterium]|nr:hypothetical protein [Oligoflexia bacterium]
MGKNILIVSAAMSFQKSIGDALQLNGLKVTSTTEGFHALSLLEGDKFSLAIVGPDVRVMSSLEVISLMRTKFNKDILPIIRILDNEDRNGSGSKSEQVNQEMFDSLKCGANEAICKPDIRKLVDKVKALTTQTATQTAQKISTK